MKVGTWRASGRGGSGELGLRIARLRAAGPQLSSTRSMAGSCGRGAGLGWTWRPVARDPLLARAFHSCTELRGRFYLVGAPSWRSERAEQRNGGLRSGWEPGRAGGGTGRPRRSHHDAAPVGGRWLCVVGGWTGRAAQRPHS